MSNQKGSQNKAVDMTENISTENAGTENAGTENAGTENAGTENVSTESVSTEKNKADKSGSDRSKTGKIKVEKNKHASHSSGTRWEKLDNTANLFPIIANENMTNVYRIAATMKEDINPKSLQLALEKVLPYFDIFQYKLKQGFFWYYFENNHMPCPKVREETQAPCQFINQYDNNEYLFRVTYYKKRINLEVFHVLADGSGGMAFMKELVYQYLRLEHPELKGKVVDGFHSETSFDREDSYVKNYKHSSRNTYKQKRAVTIRGEKLAIGGFGLIHGYIDLAQVKKISKQYGVTINQYLLAVFTWSVYVNYLNKMPSKKAISTCVPVNLRPYFGSDTLKNFFVMVSAVFKPEKDDYTFEEVLEITTKSLKSQVTKENLEKLLSYNVSNQKNIVLRAVPITFKKIALKLIYSQMAKANTSTITNIGQIQIDEQYRSYIDKFYACIAMSEGQNIKGAVCSYGDTLIFTFSSNLQSTVIQKGFFQKLTEDGIDVSIETNGVYYE